MSAERGFKADADRTRDRFALHQRWSSFGDSGRARAWTLDGPRKQANSVPGETYHDFIVIRFQRSEDAAEISGLHREEVKETDEAK